MYSFMNDYNEIAHENILDAIAKNNMVQTLGYGEDGFCDMAKELIKQGLFTATVSQHPIYMGREAARVAYDYLEGKKVEQDIYIKVDLINVGNISRFDISKWQ